MVPVYPLSDSSVGAYAVHHPGLFAQSWNLLVSSGIPDSVKPLPPSYSSLPKRHHLHPAPLSITPGLSLKTKMSSLQKHPDLSDHPPSQSKRHPP